MLWLILSTDELIFVLFILPDSLLDRWTALLNTAGQASYAERILYFDCILAIMVRYDLV